VLAVFYFSCFLSTFPALGQAAPRREAETRRQPRLLGVAAVLNLRDYGAVGDGVTNDSPALQQALDDLASLGGGTLHVPAGRYLLGTPVLEQFAPSAEVIIEGEPSDTPINIPGNGSGLDLPSEFIVAVGETNDAIALSGSTALTIKDVCFIGVQEVASDARTVLALTDINQVTIYHSEFYGLASFVAGGAIVSVTHADLKIEQTAFLGCGADSGVGTSIVETSSWLGINVTDSKFVDYGNRPEFYSKTPLAAPYSWIFIGKAAEPEPNWSRREAIIRNVLLDEGAWQAIAARPDLSGPTFPPYEVYLSRLYVNVTNLGGTGVYIAGARRVFIERSHLGWSHNAGAAIALKPVAEAILDLNDCVEDANKILVDGERVAVINSIFATLESTAPFTRVITTKTPEEDPAQYVRQQYLAALNQEPDPASHYYWTDEILRCDADASCVSGVQAALTAFLNAAPPARFSVSGQVFDEFGAPLAAAMVSLTGSQVVAMETDANGRFSFTNLATAGSYVLTPAETHYTFESQPLVTPTADQVMNFTGASIRHAISGRVLKNTGQGLAGATLTLSGSQEGATVSDAMGNFSFPDLAGGGDYEVSVDRANYVFDESSHSFTNLSTDQSVVFGGDLLNYTISGTITNAEGVPFSGIVVTLTGGVGTSQTTGANGTYSFTVHGEDNYTVKPSRPHYTFSPASQVFTNLSGDQTQNFIGTPQDFVVSGEVTSNFGEDVTGVALNVSGTETEQIMLDDSSNYALSLQAEGNYVLTPSSSNYTFVPASINVNNLTEHRTLNFVAYIKPGVPVLIAGPDPSRAVALDAVLRTTEPFKLQYDYPWTADRRTRVMLFATHFELLPNEGPSNLTATVEDAAQRVYPLTVEFAGKVEGVPSLTYIIVRLSDDLSEVGDVLVQIGHHGFTSEPMYIAIGHLGDESAAKVPAVQFWRATGGNAGTLSGTRPCSFLPSQSVEGCF